MISSTTAVVEKSPYFVRTSGTLAQSSATGRTGRGVQFRVRALVAGLVDRPRHAIRALAGPGFGGVEPETTGRPACHPATPLKIYVYGYLNRVQSSRRLERECQRNIELVWLTNRLMPDFKTIADFRKDNGKAIF